MKSDISVYEINNHKQYGLPTFISFVVVKGHLTSDDEDEITASYREFWDSRATFTKEDFDKFLEDQFMKYGCEILTMSPGYGEIHLYGYGFNK